MNGSELDKMAPWVVLILILTVLTAPIWYPIDVYRKWKRGKPARSR
jgi:hypothetical protein